MEDNNLLRRERARKAQKKKIIEEMRAALPVYTLEDIRQYKLPYDQALLCSLEERGYTSSVSYIKFMLDFQEDLRNEAGPLSPVWARPQLCSSKEVLKYLSDRLIEIENYYRMNNLAMVCETILKIAVHFAFSSESWWWLGEQLIISSLNLSGRYTSIGDLYEALGRYCYGKFLIENFHKHDAAADHLKIARDLSNGRQWTTKILFPEESDVLFLKVNYLLYICFIGQVEELMHTDYRKAGVIAVLAKKRAAEACYPEGEIRALMLKGMCQLSYNDTKGAIETFTKTYYIQVKLGSSKGICESRIHMAKAYLLHGDNQLSLATLLLLRESAEEHELPYYLAQSYRHLGEFFLNNGEAPKATPLLAESLKIFHECNYIKESEQVRNLEAISIGLELFPKYLRLLSKTNKKEHLMELVDWKDSRKIFVSDIGSTDSYTVQDVIEDSLTELRSSSSKEKRDGADEVDDTEEHECKKVKIDDNPEILTLDTEQLSEVDVMDE